MLGWGEAENVGNRTYEKRGSDETYYEYDATNALTRMHELTGDEWTCFAYDQRGNCTEIEECDGTTYFEYNDTNLVTSIKYENNVVNYFYYDSRLRRYAMEDSAGLSYFTYDQDGLCQLVERDGSGSVVAEHTRGYAPIAGIGDMAAAKIITSQGTYYRYDTYDNRGNVIRTVDESGTVTGYFEYDAWGKKLREEAPPEGTRFGQSAPAWIDLTDDPDGELRLTPTRLYHASVARFLSRDVQRHDGATDVYGYLSASAPAYADPSGLKECCCNGKPYEPGDRVGPFPYWGPWFYYHLVKSTKSPVSSSLEDLLRDVLEKGAKATLEKLIEIYGYASALDMLSRAIKGCSSVTHMAVWWCISQRRQFNRYYICQQDGTWEMERPMALIGVQIRSDPYDEGVSGGTTVGPKEALATCLNEIEEKNKNFSIPEPCNDINENR